MAVHLVTKHFLHLLLVILVTTNILHVKRLPWKKKTKKIIHTVDLENCKVTLVQICTAVLQNNKHLS